MRLGEKRARSVADFLLKSGVTSDRFIIKSIGEEDPIVSNDSEEGRRLNRRVDFRVIE